MGAKSSKERVEGSHVVKVRGSGKRETYRRSVSAKEIMLRHPQHVLTRLDVQAPDFWKSIVSPDSVLLPGNKYFLVRRRTMERILHQHSARPLGDESGGTNFFSDLVVKTEHPSFSDILRLPPMDSVFTNPHPFADEQGYLDKGREKSPKFSLCMSPKSPLFLSPKSPWRFSPKSPLQFSPKFPLGFTRSDESNQRPWRSSPKVCPGEYYPLGDEQLSNICLNSLSQADAVKDEVNEELDKVMNDGGRLYSSASEGQCQVKVIDEKHSSAEEAVALNQAFNLRITSKIESSLLTKTDTALDKNFISSEEPQKKSLLDLLKCPDQQWFISTPQEETCKPDIVICELEAFKVNGCADRMFEDKAKDNALPGEGKDTGVIDTNIQLMQRSTIEESAELQRDVPGVPAIESVVIPCLQQANSHHTMMQVYPSMPSASLEGVEKDLAGQLHGSNQLYFIAENSKSGPVPQARDCVFFNKIGSGIPSQSPLLNSPEQDLNQDQLKEFCGHTPLESSWKQQSSNLIIPPVVGLFKEPEAKSSLMIQPIDGISEEPEANSPLLERETAIAVDESIDNTLAKECNIQIGRTLGEIFSDRSPDFLELMNAGRRMQGLYPLHSSLKETQGNLNLLGFNSIRSDSLSIYAQAMAHSRAHWFNPSRGKTSNLIKQKQECFSSEIKHGQDEAWRPSTSQYRGSPHRISPRQLRELLLQPTKKKRLSPIPELSPELSPAHLR